MKKLILLFSAIILLSCADNPQSRDWEDTYVSNYNTDQVVKLLVDPLTLKANDTLCVISVKRSRENGYTIFISKKH